MNTRLTFTDDEALILSEVSRKRFRTIVKQAKCYVLEGLQRDRELWPDLDDQQSRPVDQTVAA